MNTIPAAVTATFNAKPRPMAERANCREAAQIVDKLAIAQMLGFSTRHIDNLLAQGLPHMKFGERRVRFDQAEVLAWCKERFGTRRTGPLHPTAYHKDTD